MPMALTNTYGMILMANKCFEDCFRKGEERIKGRYIHDVVGINIADLKGGYPTTSVGKIKALRSSIPNLRKRHGPCTSCTLWIWALKELEGAKGPNETTFCYILIDNYDEIIEQLPATRRSAVLSELLFPLRIGPIDWMLFYWV